MRVDSCPSFFEAYHLATFRKPGVFERTKEFGYVGFNQLDIVFFAPECLFDGRKACPYREAKRNRFCAQLLTTTLENRAEIHITQRIADKHEGTAQQVSF